ncbi:MAG: LON peptidase substrate-binding domain-containing protein [Saprospiraceae bacterium]
MPEKLALFPLSLVVFPDERLNLHVFEPRYRDLLADVQNEGITFGVPTFLNGNIMPIGTEVRLTKVEQTFPTGESDIRTRGVRRFRLHEFFPRLDEKAYGGGSVTFLETDLAEDLDLNRQIVAQVRELYRLLEVDKDIQDAAAGFSIFDIAHHIGLSLADEYRLLSTESAQDRQLFILDHLKSLEPRIQQKSRLRDRALMNGHFKNVIPPRVDKGMKD